MCWLLLLRKLLLRKLLLLPLLPGSPAGVDLNVALARPCACSCAPFVPSPCICFCLQEDSQKQEAAQQYASEKGVELDKVRQGRQAGSVAGWEDSVAC